MDDTQNTMVDATNVDDETLDLDTLVAANSDLSLKVETLTEENAKLTAELADAKAALAAKPKGKVTERAAPKMRRAGPMADGKALTGDELGAAIADADDVEIVFSDGKKEIEGVPARSIEGDVWRNHTLGRMLRDPVMIGGATVPTQLVGYALFVDGKQVAWTPRSDAINLAPGQSVQLVDDIYFA